MFFASSSVFAGTSLPSTPPDREGYYEFLGIDVSEWQGSIDWNAVKDDGVNYAFIRAGATTSSNFDLKTDSKFDVNMEGARQQASHEEYTGILRPRTKMKLLLKLRSSLRLLRSMI